MSDARKIHNWVFNTLHVPSDRVELLLDRDATRQNIINRLGAIAKNDAIQKDDPILIYYAGHGAQQPAPQDLNWDSNIQMILPWDYWQPRGTGHVDGIPDVLLGSLISRISEAKGNNIVGISACRSSECSCRFRW